VFTERPFLGNPVAVVLEGGGLSDADMLRIAAWTNLSETTFVLPSSRASYRLRIFTPRAELLFAGHPTIGSAHAVREAGLIPASARSLVQECGAGLIPLSVDSSGNIHAQVPKARVSPFTDLGMLCAALGAPVEAPLIVDVGPRWIVARLESREALLRLSPDPVALSALSQATGTGGATIYALADGGVEVRSFAPLHGIAEDPVCGSGCASVGVHLRELDGISGWSGGRLRARQGAAMNRAGEVWVQIGADEVSIGGAAITVVEGSILLE